VVVVVLEVVVVVAAVPVVLVSSLNAFPVVPDAFPVVPDASPGFLAASELAFQSLCSPFVAAGASERQLLDLSQLVGVQRIHLWLLLVNNPPAVVVGR
jgi:hypothetical protein